MNRERLVFPSPEASADFIRSVETRIQEESRPGISKQREIISQELGKQFDQAGHGVSELTHPWEHTDAEHKEAQELVDVAFHHGLSVAIAQAEKSSSFPRNIDLFHDVLTGEMYDTLKASRVNVVHMPRWMIPLLVVFFALLLTAILTFAYFV